MRSCALLLVCSALLGASPPASPPAERITFEPILADPAAYDGRRVRIQGFLKLGYGDHSLWATDTDFENLDYERAAWLNTELGSLEDEHPLYGRQVFLSGVVNAADRGAYELYRLSLNEISDIVIHPSDRDRPRPWHDDLLAFTLGVLALIYAVVLWRGLAPPRVGTAHRDL